MNRLQRIFPALLVIAACAAPEGVHLPGAPLPLTRETIAGRWIVRQSQMVKTDAPSIRQTFRVATAHANLSIFGTDGSFSSPTESGASARGTYRISGDTVVVRTEDGDSTVWSPVRLSGRWMVQTTAHGAHDFDGNGATEWATATYLYERQ